MEQHRAQYQNATRQAAQISAASLLASFPEIANIPASHLQSAIAAIGVQNPQRAEAIRSHLGRTEALFNASRQAEAAQQQIQAQQQAQQMQQVKNWVAAQDEHFEKNVIAKTDPATLEKIKANIVQIVEEDYGVSRQELAQLWQSQPIIRSSAFQSMMLDAAKYRMAQRDAAGKLDRSVPPVQRPGVSQPSDNSGVTHAINRFKSDPSVANASKLLLARRAAAKR